MSASAYVATVKLVDEGYDHHGTTLPAIFIVGDDPDDRLALGKVLDNPEYDWLGDFAYYEMDKLSWLVVKAGQNTGNGYMVKTDQPITKLNIHPWNYFTATKENIK